MRSTTSFLLVVTLLTAAEVLWAKEVQTAAFSSSEPDELQFSCALVLDTREEACAKALVEEDAADRLAAARALWRGHSRRHAAKVLMYLAGPPPGGEEYRAFQREVESSLQPEAILRELRKGDYQWGAWLAFLRPRKEFVPTLLAALEDRPKMLPETMLALGNSGDPRALKPLLHLLKSKDYRTAGDAAQGLGYLGGPEVEPRLIEALGADNGWLQVNACGALAKLGTRRALPALEKLAKEDRYTGALNVKGMAQYAVASIKKRGKKSAVTGRRWR
jgi:HEAT repeat protein